MPSRFIKLVRDKVGEDSDRVVYERCIGFTDDDFHWALRRKLMEEAIEYFEHGEWEELVDVFEVVWALSQVHGVGKGMHILKRDADRKRVAKGSFMGRVAMWIHREAE